MSCAIAAAGHHRKFPPTPREAEPLTLLLSHPDFASTCALGRRLGLPPPPPLPDHVIDRAASLHRTMVDWDERLGQELGRRWWRLVSVAKALVIAADVAGSAQPSAGSPHERKPQWIRDELGRSDADAVSSVVAARLGGRTLRPFQERVRDSNAPVVLVQAGCGKTIAAYAWAARQHPRARPPSRSFRVTRSSVELRAPTLKWRRRSTAARRCCGCATRWAARSLLRGGIELVDGRKSSLP
jgi:CRISPR-associated endonuclease/helicase Cas3